MPPSTSTQDEEAIPLSMALRQVVSLTFLWLLRMNSLKQSRLFGVTRGDLLTVLRCSRHILETAMSMTPNLTPDKTGSQSEKSDESVDDPRIDVPTRWRRPRFAVCFDYLLTDKCILNKTSYRNEYCVSMNPIPRPVQLRAQTENYHYLTCQLTSLRI